MTGLAVRLSTALKEILPRLYMRLQASIDHVQREMPDVC